MRKPYRSVDRTKSNIKTAFAELLGEKKNMECITVSELVARANIAKSTRLTLSQWRWMSISPYLERPSNMPLTHWMGLVIPTTLCGTCWTRYCRRKPMNNDITVAALRRVNYLLERLATKKDYHGPEEVQKDIDEAKDLVR